MDYFCAFSWPYSSSAEADARNFFNKLSTGINGGKKFPLLKPHEIALVRNPSGDIFVGVLVLTGTEVDDSVETHEKVVSWLKECGAEGYQDYETLPTRGQNIQSSLGVDYTVLDILEGFRIKSEPVKRKRKAPVVRDADEERASHANMDLQPALEGPPRGLPWLYFSLNGRIGLQTFWLKGYFPLFVVYLLTGIADVVAEANGLLYLLVGPLLLWPTLAVNVKRWHDRGKSGWWVLIALIPVVGWIWAFIETGFLKGTDGPNQFGPPEIQSKEAHVAPARKTTRPAKGAPELSYFFICSGNASLIDAYNSLFKVGARAYNGSAGHYYASLSLLDVREQETGKTSLPFVGQSYMGAKSTPVSQTHEVLQNIRVAASREAHVAFVSVDQTGISWVHKVYNELLNQAVSQGILPFEMYVTKDKNATQFLLGSFSKVS